MNSKLKPTWWLLDGLIASTILSLLALQQFVLSYPVRQMLQAVLVVLGYSLAAVWLRTNAVALEAQEERPKKDGDVT
jgi:hypothetical protein